MRLRRFFLCMVLVSFFVAPSWVLAFDFKPAGLTPLSFWYFLETLKEEAVLFFTFSPLQKIDKLVQLSSEKMSEVEEVIETNPGRASVSLARAKNLLARIEKLASAAKKDKNFVKKRTEWQEILAQEMVFLVERKSLLAQSEEMVSLIREVRQILK